MHTVNGGKNAQSTFRTQTMQLQDRTENRFRTHTLQLQDCTENAHSAAARTHREQVQNAHSAAERAQRIGLKKYTVQMNVQSTHSECSHSS